MCNYVAPPLGFFATSDAPFDQVRINMVAPLTPSHGETFLLTCIVKLTKWPETIPTPTIKAESLAWHSVEGRNVMYDCPPTVAIDRVRQL